MWQDNIDALRDVVTKRTAFRPPNRDNATQYLEGLNQDQLRAIQEMTTRYTQEINLSCEQKYGSMSRTRDGEVSSAQTHLEARMRDGLHPTSRLHSARSTAPRSQRTWRSATSRSGSH